MVENNNISIDKVKSNLDLMPYFLLQEYDIKSEIRDSKTFKDGSVLDFTTVTLKPWWGIEIEVSMSSVITSFFKTRTLKGDDDYGSSMCMSFYDYATNKCIGRRERPILLRVKKDGKNVNMYSNTLTFEQYIFDNIDSWKK